MLEDRENHCVVCASQNGLTLHHVVSHHLSDCVLALCCLSYTWTLKVPYVYRQWFPLSIKSKSVRGVARTYAHNERQRERMKGKGDNGGEREISLIWNTKTLLQLLHLRAAIYYFCARYATTVMKDMRLRSRNRLRQSTIFHLKAKAG